MAKKIVIVLVGIVAVAITWSLIGQIMTTLKSGDRLQEATERLHKLEVKNKELKRKLEEVKTPAFLEEQARDKLGLVREGETIVIIPQEKLDRVLGVTKKVEEVKLPNWLGWLKLFFK